MLLSKMTTILTTGLLLSSLSARAYDDIDFAKYCITGIISIQCESFDAFDPSGGCEAKVGLAERANPNNVSQKPVSFGHSGPWSEEDGRLFSILTVGAGAPPTLASSSFSHSQNNIAASSNLNEELDSYKAMYRCAWLVKKQNEE